MPTLVPYTKYYAKHKAVTDLMYDIDIKAAAESLFPIGLAQEMKDRRWLPERDCVITDHDEYVQLIASAKRDLFDFSDMDIPLPQPTVPVGLREEHILALAQGQTTDSIGTFGMGNADLSSIALADDADDPYQYVPENDETLSANSSRDTDNKDAQSQVSQQSARSHRSSRSHHSHRSQRSQMSQGSQMSTDQFTQLQELMKASMQEMVAGINRRIDQLIIRENQHPDPPSNIHNSIPSTISPITGPNSQPSPRENPLSEDPLRQPDTLPTPAGGVTAGEDT